MTERTVLEYIKKQLSALGYPSDKLREEYELEKNTRADLVVLDDVGNPFIVAEAKTPSHLHIALARNQLETYLRQTNSRYGVLSDGYETHCYLRLDSGEIIEVPTIPRWKEQLTSYDWERSKLKTLTSPISTFWKVDDILRASRVHAGDRLRELQKILLCKFIDETKPETSSWFAVFDTSPETRKDEPCSTKVRIDELFERVKRRYPDIFRADEKIQLDENTVSKIVAILQSYSITQNPASFSKAFERMIEQSFLFSNKYTGAYYTPRPLAKFLIELVGPTPADRIIDLACGTGQILLEYIEYSTANFRDPTKQNFASNVFGIDVSSEMVSIAKTNMVLHGDGRSSIFLHDALLASLPDPIEAVVREGGFNLVVVDPPLGRTMDVKPYHRSVLAGARTVDAAILFLETALRTSKVGGRIAIVLPEKFLFSESLQNIRDFLRKRTLIRAIVRLPTGLLRPYTGISLNVVLLEKKAADTDHEDYSILMADAPREEALNDIARVLKEPHPKTKDGVFSVNARALGSDWSVRYHSTPRATYGQPLGNLASILRGAPVNSQDYLEDKTRGIPVIRISDISKLAVQPQNMRTIRESSSSVRQRSKANINDILFSVSGTIGKVGVVPASLQGSIVHANLMIVRPDPNFLYTEFLAWFLSSKYVKDQLDRIVTGSVIQHVSIRAIQELRILVPSLAEQKRILDAAKTPLEQIGEISLPKFEQEISKFVELP